MKFYIAARFTEKDEVRRIYDILVTKGHKIAVDWTKHKTIKPYDKNSKLAAEYAIEDMNGVINCDIFVLLTSENTGSGSSGELGAAILSKIKFNKPNIYVIGNHFGNNFFYFHPVVKMKRDINEVLEDIEYLSN